MGGLQHWESGCRDVSAVTWICSLPISELRLLHLPNEGVGFGWGSLGLCQGMLYGQGLLGLSTGGGVGEAYHPFFLFSERVHFVSFVLWAFYVRFSVGR